MPPCPESSARMVEGMVHPPLHCVAGETADCALEVKHVTHLVGGRYCRRWLIVYTVWGLQATGTVLRGNCWRSTADLCIVGSTAGWGKGCFLSCAAPRQTASPFPHAQAPSGWHTQERWQGSSLPVPAITVEDRLPGAGHSCGTDEFGGEVVCFLHEMKLRPKAPRQTLGRQCC